MAQEGTKSLELVVKLGSGRELHLVPSRGKRLDDWGGDRDWTRDEVRTARSHGARNSVQTEFGSCGTCNSVRTEFTDCDLGSSLANRRVFSNRPFRQLSQQRRHVGAGSPLCDELLDLPLGLVDRSSEKHVPVLPRQVPRQLGDAAQVETTVGEHLQDHRVLSSRPSHRDPQVGLGLGEVEDVGAVDEHRGGGLAGVEAPHLHLGDVGDEIGLHAAGLTRAAR